MGEPVPDISWYFNGVMINVSDNSSKYMIMSRSLNITTTENTLTVYNITSSDVGIYTCNSSNFIGSTTNSGILTVTSKYRITGYLHEVQIFTNAVLLALAEILIIKKFTTLNSCNQHLAKIYRSFVVQLRSYHEHNLYLSS